MAFYGNIGGDRSPGEGGGAHGRRFFGMEMNDKTSNLESAQLWQPMLLMVGCAYEFTFRMPWENRGDRMNGAIVIFGIDREAFNTWYGYVDQALKP